MKINIYKFLLFTALFLFLSPFAGSAQDFTINDFSVNILVNQDSSFTVKETITVDFHRPRHGIYREIPYVYEDSLGRDIRTPTEILSVTDGLDNKIKSRIVRSGNTLRIRIGDPDRYVKGQQRYEIFYKVENSILFFDDHDELYWNVTGNYWQARIRNVKCTVSLSGKKTGKHLAACYTGAIGSAQSACNYTHSDNVVYYSSSKELLPGEGLTIAYGWDKGIVSPPTSFRRFLWLVNLEQNWVFVLPFISLIIMLNLWLKRGRDPKTRESVTVIYEPPKHNNLPLSPAEVGAMIDEKLDSRDITATIVGLAVKGYIKIEETKEEGLLFDSRDCYLKKIKEPDDSLSLFEKKLMSDILGSKPGVMVSDLKNSFYARIDLLKKTLYNELIRKKYFSVSPEKTRQAYAVSGFLATVAIISLLGFSVGNEIGGLRTFLAGILAGLPLFGFSRFMPAKTKAGSAVYMDIIGFQEFLNRAEKDRLIRMKDENLFSKYFPYALALDVADNWAKAFEGIYQRPPDWYVSPTGFRTFSPAGFSRSINSAMSSISSAIFSAPRGSGVGGGSGGFSGGGFSGGGFGGGGGGSW
ncbi:MAG: DUF2207 domain-containing protein [Nitrospirota bacterium]